MDLLPPPPAALQIAVAANLPAAIPALPILLGVHYLGVKHMEWLSYSVFGFFVPVLWYFVGGWVDRRVGLSPRLMRKHSVLANACFGLLILLALSAAVAAAGSTGWHNGDRLMRLSVFVWSAFGAIVLYVRITKETHRTG